MATATKNIVAEVTNALEEYSLEAERLVKEAAKEAAEATAAELKRTSPKKARRGGKYARGWAVKKVEEAGLVSYVVYNKANPGLTHTLEHGHVVRNQHGTYGRAKAIPHIAPAADSGAAKFEQNTLEKLRK